MMTDANKAKTDDLDQTRLLLAGDLPSIRDSLSRLLRRQGYNVVLAGNGLEAGERVSAAHFELAPQLGSAAERLLRDVPCSVLAIKPPGSAGVVTA